MTWSWSSIEASNSRPSIEPITFPCRADALRVMPRTRVKPQITLLEKHNVDDIFAMALIQQIFILNKIF